MKAQDLRIGNWVKWNYEESSDGNAYPVEFGYELDDIKNNPNIVEPIQLTEELLERFGFASIVFTVNHSRKVKDDYRKESNGYFVKLSKGLNNPDTFYYFPSNVGKGLPVKYVHSLQNLYFSITGEELELKP